MQAGNFTQEMDKLWRFASTAENFECKDIEAALNEIQTIMEQNNNLSNQLEEERNRTAEKAESQDNTMCVLPGFCLNVPSFGGFSGGILVLGIILGLAFGCFCAGKCKMDVCAFCRCCCPERFGARGADDTDQDIHIHIDNDDTEKEKLANFD